MQSFDHSVSFCKGQCEKCCSLCQCCSEADAKIRPVLATGYVLDFCIRLLPA